MVEVLLRSGKVRRHVGTGCTLVLMRAYRTTDKDYGFKLGHRRCVRV